MPVNNSRSDYISALSEREERFTRELNEAIEKYGENSKQAKKASEQLAKVVDEASEDLDKFSKNFKTNLGSFIVEYRKAQKEGNADRKELNEILLSGLNSVANSLKSNLDSTINKYVSSIEKLSYSLNGSVRGYSDVTSNLNRVLNGQNLVSQESAFSNLTKIVSAGIVNNPEQKAFLQTLSEDLGMQFSVSNDTLRQLVRIQGEDSTANRMAIEYSLNEFLVQNYQTGEYIRNGFTEVSRALIQSQATMTGAMAASYEATVQTWMGSLYSSGVSQNTISQLAAAIDAVGSGNISGLGQGMSNLVLMGAARAGLDYGELLNNGFQGNDINRLMQGITSYIGEMSGYSSNVVMNQLGNLFGLQMSDIMAIRNNGVPNVAGIGANADASSMLGSINGLVPSAVRLMNSINNFQFGWGANIASSPGLLTTYLGLRHIAEPIANLAADISHLWDPTGITANLISGIGGNASLITLLPQLFGFDGGGFSWKNVGGPINGLIRQIFGGESSSALGVYNALAGDGGSSNVSVVVSDRGVSGSMGISHGGSGGLLDSFTGSMNDLGVEEVTGDEETVDDHVANIDTNVASIVDILQVMRSSLAFSSPGAAIGAAVSYGERGIRDALFT